MLAYCDYIAGVIKTGLDTDSKTSRSLVGNVGRVRYDLDSTGALNSTTKTISVVDVNGKAYRVTVEEM